MAAIAGIMPRQGGTDRTALLAALGVCRDVMRRRAPIEGGMAVAYDGSIGLAHQASEGPGGEAVLQPLRNETGSLWLVADGEPSNAAELRLELIAAGHRFQSACGSEVILHLYEDAGVSAFERLAGGFAFALWDREQRQLVLGRDRFGEKPLYVREGPDQVAFASEVRALDVQGPLSAAAITAFLTLGYLPEPLTVTGDVRAVTPGTFIRMRDRRRRAESFWDHASAAPSGDTNEDRVVLGRLVRESVQTAVAGEEDVGIVLDGSQTRAALLALVSPTLARGLRTHTLVFDESGRPADAVAAERSAAAHARALAAWFRSDHAEHRVSVEEVAAAFEAASEADQPSIGGTMAQLIAAFLGAAGDRLLVSGLGGTELLGVATPRWSPWVWRAGRRAPARLLCGVTSRLLSRMRPFGRAARVADGLAGGDAIAAAHLAARGVLASAALRRLIRAEVLATATGQFDAFAYLRTLGSAATAAGGPPSAQLATRTVAAVERRGHLMSGRLRDLEGAAASLGLALRVPYLDHRLCDWLDAASGPRGGALLVREVLDGTIPQRLRSRFRPTESPLSTWMLGGLRPVVEAHVLGDDPDGWFLRPGLERLWQGFLRGSVDWRSVWAVAVLRAWIAARRASEHATSRRRRRRARDAA